MVADSQQLEGWDAIDEAAASGNNMLAQAFRRCFNTADGIAVLEHLQDRTGGNLPADAPNRVLRDVAGQRRVVGYIEQMIARGVSE